MKKHLIIFLCMVFTAGAAQAAEWNFYGAARVATFYSDVDFNTPGTDNPDTQFEESLSAESVVGAEVKVNDSLTGVFEYGADSGTADVRYLYGVWDFGAGSLEIGKNDGTLALPGSDQAYADDAGLGGWGEMSSEKKAQIRLIFGKFQIAFRAPDSGFYDTGTSATLEDDTQNIMPSIEAKYTLSANNYNVMINGGYHTFDVGADDQDITSYVLGLGGDCSFGAFSLASSIFLGQNVGNLVDCDVNGEDSGAGYARYDGTNVQDNDALAWKVVVSYTFNDMLAAQAGYGFMQTEVDETSTEDEVQAYYLQVPITLAPGVSVVPEAGVIDYRETGQDETTYFGAKWQIEF